MTFPSSADHDIILITHAHLCTHDSVFRQYVHKLKWKDHSFEWILLQKDGVHSHEEQAHRSTESTKKQNMV